jgi:serine/threonine-protein kinase RsbW
MGRWPTFVPRVCESLDRGRGMMGTVESRRQRSRGAQEVSQEEGSGPEESGGGSGGYAVIELSIPAQPVLLQLVRMTAGIVAARADLDLNHVEDLRLAVDELCLPFMGPEGHDGRLYMRFEWNEENIEISCTLARGGEEGAEVIRMGAPTGPRRAISGLVGRLRDELSAQILDALVDEHGEMTIDGRPGVWLRMGVGQTAGGPVTQTES